MIQKVMNTSRSDKELVFDLLESNKGQRFTGFEIANILNTDVKTMTEGSASRYCRTLRLNKRVKDADRTREHGKPFKEYWVE